MTRLSTRELRRMTSAPRRPAGLARVHLSWTDGVVVVDVRGPVDTRTAEDVTDALAFAAVAPDVDRVVVNLGGAELTGSAQDELLGALAGSRHHAGRCLMLVAPRTVRAPAEAALRRCGIPVVGELREALDPAR
jgi:anti-anti-sigma regulatory factor